ncbi:GntR family transcriptional regulator [Paenarthrobacter aurescens]|jgi:DNA-binding GntR family transcriptional regulator|uniref:Transcriptional regulator, GntR family n=1 Tax=Paenarthrobacter aurescens (strain TC1) TaxID=290340 RepID=A1RDL6_PAEAT|nr:GntR family transcriptional regulator [Paenarthrobacter aurescens]ABM10754.1 transcriptional regulator, GntR family [Paenarthrobacter aurescens TC1]
MNAGTGTVSAGAAEKAASTLRERIVTGALPPGTAVREVVVAEELGVSRNTLREAFRRLAWENLLDIERHKGAVVKMMSTEDIHDIYLVRRTIELKAIEESALASPDSLARLRQAAYAVGQASSADDWEGVATAGLRFHQAIVSTLGSPRLDATFVPIVAQIRLAFAPAINQEQFQKPFAARDREICDLMLAGSRAAAGMALHSYLQDAEQILSDLVEAGPRPAKTAS